MRAGACVGICPDDRRAQEDLTGAPLHLAVAAVMWLKFRAAVAGLVAPPQRTPPQRKKKRKMPERPRPGWANATR